MIPPITKGKVVSFYPERLFGFISSGRGNDEIFFHRNDQVFSIVTNSGVLFHHLAPTKSNVFVTQIQDLYGRDFLQALIPFPLKGDGVFFKAITAPKGPKARFWWLAEDKETTEKIVSLNAQRKLTTYRVAEPETNATEQIRVIWEGVDLRDPKLWMALKGKYTRLERREGRNWVEIDQVGEKKEFYKTLGKT